MGAVTRSQLKKIFKRIDGRMKKSVDIYIIGGASAILGYNVIKETNDIDVDGDIDSDFQRLFLEEVSALGLDIYLSSRGVFSPPDGYRERMKSEEFPKGKLRVWYLDQYDLAISKVERGLEKDYEDIKRVHQRSPYDRERLIQIFNTEYIAVSAIGNKREKKMNLLDLIAMLFGDEVLEDSKRKVGY